MPTLLSLCLFIGMMFTTACHSTSDSSSQRTGQTPSVTAATTDLDDTYADLQKAVFAGGCFWCIEAVFERVKGVEDVISGYTGGKEDSPKYEDVSYGRTSHAEAVAIYYDPAVISYAQLLEIFFAVHDPTQVDGQGPDIGRQYRTEIFYQDKDQQQLADDHILQLTNSGIYDAPIATQVTKGSTFWPAEEYHQNYYELHPNHAYIVRWARPKVAKLLKYFPDWVKEKYKD